MWEIVLIMIVVYVDIIKGKKNFMGIIKKFPSEKKASQFRDALEKNYILRNSYSLIYNKRKYSEEYSSEYFEREYDNYDFYNCRNHSYVTFKVCHYDLESVWGSLTLGNLSSLSSENDEKYLLIEEIGGGFPPNVVETVASLNEARMEKILLELQGIEVQIVKDI